MRVAKPEAVPGRISSSSVRLRGLDTLRGVAAILVVLLHTGIPYMTNPLSHLAWPARDINPSSIVDALTWCIECFVMPLFFVLAGFFSKGVLDARGEQDFLKGRTRRLLVTQIVAGLVILPISLVIWIVGWVADGLYVPGRYPILGLPDELKAELYGVAHLWFLQNLYIYCLVLCGISWLTRRMGSRTQAECIESRSDKGVDRILVSIWKPLIPAMPCALILYFDPRIVLGFYQTFIPVFSKLVYYAIFFFVGVTINRQRSALHLHARFGKTYLAVAGILFAAALPLIREHLTSVLPGPRLAILSGLLALFASFTTFGLFAYFLQANRGENVVTQYLAQASFWVYLVHLPFVALAQIALAQSPIPSVGKFAIAAAITMGLSLLSFHAIVRNTWLGKFVNGNCNPRDPVREGLQPELAAGIRIEMAHTTNDHTPHIAHSRRRRRVHNGL